MVSKIRINPSDIEKIEANLKRNGLQLDEISYSIPNSVNIITLEGKKVEETTVNSTCTFLFIYIMSMVLLMFLISFDKFSFEIIVNAVFTTFANVGLCFEFGSFSMFSEFSKVVLTIGMLFGRLEIFPLIGLISNLRK